jgi:hypothetical protein
MAGDTMDGRPVGAAGNGDNPGAGGEIADAPQPGAQGTAPEKKKLDVLKKCQDPQVLAAQQAQCAADAAADQQTYNALKTTFDSLSKATYQHNLDVSSYETQLQNYSNSLAAFQAALATYLQDLAGRTFTTTALNDEADQLSAQRGPLVTTQGQVSQQFSALQNDATAENQEETDLKQGLTALSAAIGASLKALDCIKCTALVALQGQTDSLLGRSNFTIKNPSASPADVPTVPRLPAPPQPPSPLVGPPAPNSHVKPGSPAAPGPGVTVVEYFYASTTYAPNGQEVLVTPIADPEPPVTP